MLHCLTTNNTHKKITQQKMFGYSKFGLNNKAKLLSIYRLLLSLLSLMPFMFEYKKNICNCCRGILNSIINTCICFEWQHKESQILQIYKETIQCFALWIQVKSNIYIENFNSIKMKNLSQKFFCYWWKMMDKIWLENMWVILFE